MTITNFFIHDTMKGGDRNNSIQNKKEMQPHLQKVQRLACESFDFYRNLLFIVNICVTVGIICIYALAPSYELCALISMVADIILTGAFLFVSSRVG